jgi:hypothetical protein
MTSTTVVARDTSPARSATPARSSFGGSGDRNDANSAPVSRRAGTPGLGRNASDDDILGLATSGNRLSARGRENDLDPQLAFDFDAEPSQGNDTGTRLDDDLSPSRESKNGEPDNLRAVFDANPALRKDWEDANAYRESFATPEDARNATAMLSDLNRMDALFFSRRPEDHAELARSIASLDPAAFESLARAMSAQSAKEPVLRGREPIQQQIPRRPQDSLARDDNEFVSGDPAKAERRAQPAVPLGHQTPANSAEPTAAQTDFFHSTNAAAVETVLDAIETQVERLLPDGVSKNARNRVVGEIYRELDGTLRSNRQLGQQMRDAFRSGSLDAEHQRAIVSMIAGRARQALPGVAKRVLSEWTSTVVAASQDRRSRQRAAERRVDIAGSRGGGGEGHRATSPRDLDYARMSDADILNL